MIPLQMDVTPYTINAVSLVIIGLASTIYLLRLKEKLVTTWCMIIGLVSFTASMVTMFLTGIVLWGSAFSPLTEAFSVVGMAAMIEFAYRYPQNATSVGSRLVRALTLAASLGALALGFGYTVRCLALHTFIPKLPLAYGYLNPATFLLALGVSIFRTIAIQSGRAPGWLGALKAFFRPQERPARLLRNFSLALSIGLVQGVVSAVGLPGIFPASLGLILINLSLLLMLAAVVYASFDFTPQQPSLVVRLAGLTLVTLQAVLGMVALYNSNLTQRWIVDRNASILENTREALLAGHMENVPWEVIYIFSWPLDSPNGTTAQEGHLVTARSIGFDSQPLLREDTAAQVPQVWGYFLEGSLIREASVHAQQIRMRYGDNPTGTFYQYVGFVLDLDAVRYEVGFSLAELSSITQSQNTGMIWGVLCSALFILFVFPLFFRSNLIRPLDRLLNGVRQADEGNLETRVTVTHNDEVGYLTTAFNKMISSLRQELDGRQEAEAQLRQLNLTLEERVSNRTRELEALYDVTAASSQARDTQTLLTILLDRSLRALRGQSGFILLFDEPVAGSKQSEVGVKLAASHNLPSNWLSYFQTMHIEDSWISSVIDNPEPLLISDTWQDVRIPPFMCQEDPLVLILAPLHAGSQALGILGMARPKQQHFDLDEVALLVSIVNQVGVAVHTDYLRQRAQQATVLEERQRLARDLHDSVTQSLYGLVTMTEVGLMQVENKTLASPQDTYRKIGQTTRQAIREMRLFIHQLRLPELEKEGLVNALDLRLAAVEGRSDVKARLIADENIHLPLPVETALYHIAQEALNNSLKHAGAANVTITLSRTPLEVVMEIVDDGKGFSITQRKNGGMGLSNMYTRAREIGASLEITSQPAQGTQVKVILKEKP